LAFAIFVAKLQTREDAKLQMRLAEERKERTPIVEEDERPSETPKASAYGSSSSSSALSSAMSFKPSGTAGGEAAVDRAELEAMKAVARYKELQRQREEESMANFDDV
jgi:hypothetical protein